MATGKVIKRPFDAQIFYGANNSDEVICAISEVFFISKRKSIAGYVTEATCGKTLPSR